MHILQYNMILRLDLSAKAKCLRIIVGPRIVDPPEAAPDFEPVAQIVGPPNSISPWGCPGLRVRGINSALFGGGVKEIIYI